MTMSIPHEKIKKIKDKQGFVQRLIASDKITRRLELLFLNDANKSC